MARRPATGGSATLGPVSGSARGLPAGAAKLRDTDGAGSARLAKSRVKQIVEVIDHCTLAKETSDRLGEDFLSYLLAMTIQESRAALRRSSTSDVSSKLLLKS